MRIRKAARAMRADPAGGDVGRSRQLMAAASTAGRATRGKPAWPGRPMRGTRLALVEDNHHRDAVTGTER
jgi:hypothetical protein